jgi:hypothetical protein
MKRLEKRVERELIDVLYSIIKSLTHSPSSVTINLNRGIEVRISKVYSLHSVAIIKRSRILLQTTLIINPYENGYTVQSLQFKRKQRLEEKRKLVRYLGRRGEMEEIKKSCRF